MTPPADPRAIMFFVPGHPVPKGSGEGTAQRRRSYRQGVAGDWRERLQLAAQRHTPRPLWRGPVRVAAVFSMRRPERIPPGPMLAPPDADKLLRFVLDELTGRIYADDAQVTTTWAHKRYAVAGEPEGLALFLYHLVGARDELEEWARLAPNAIPELSEVR